VLSWLLSKFPGVTLVLATRQLARSPTLYVVPLFLLMLTLALAIFTSSVAATLDNHLDQQTRYDLGGDVRLQQTGESQQSASVPAASGNSAGAGSGTSSSMSLGNIGVTVGGSSSSSASVAQEPATSSGPIYDFLPLTDYLKVSQVQAVTRVGRYATEIHFGVGGDAAGHVEGIDRFDFPGVAFWRKDFASTSLGELMNALATSPEAVLVPRNVMQEHALKIGDPVQVSVYFPGASFNAEFKVAGAFDLWPTWYPQKADDGPLFVGNLDYLFDQAQGQYPYDVWVKVKNGADPTVVAGQVRSLGRQQWGADDVHTVIETEMARPERQGLFGVLTIGFLAAAFFTALGFALYAVFSYRQRYIELGVLRAIGLSTAQMAAFLAWELILLLALGAVGGTVLGVMASNVYIPFLQVNSEARAVPFWVMINWPEISGIYALFGVLFLIVLIGLVWFLRRLRIFQAVRLGESL
jgi:putative ABC transport system permease protein